MSGCAGLQTINRDGSFGSSYFNIYGGFGCHGLQLHRCQYGVCCIHIVCFAFLVSNIMKRFCFLLVLLLHVVCMHALYREFEGRTHYEDSLLETAKRLSDKRNYKESFEVLTKLREMAERKNDYEMVFHCHINWAFNLAEMLNYDDALDYLSKAYKISVEKLSKREEMSTLNNMAYLYLKSNKYLQANEYFKRNYNYAKEIKDTTFLRGSALNVAISAIDMGNLEECRVYMNITEQLVKPNTEEWMSLQALKTDYLFETHQYKALISFAKRVIKMNLYPDIRQDIRINMCKAYIEMRDYDSAVAMANEGIANETDLVRKQPFYEILSEAYLCMKQYNLAFAYKDSFIVAKDSMQVRIDRVAFENSSIQFELLRKEKEISEYHARETRTQILIVFIVVLVVVLIWALSNHMVKVKQRQKIVELQLEQEKKNQELLAKKLEEQEAQSMLDQKDFQLQLEKKNRELMSKALFMANRNEAVLNIIDSLSKDVNIEKNSQLDLNIRELKSHLSENKEWSYFTTYFEESNKEFVLRLKEKHPNLTANEIRFISLVYIGLNNKEISSLLNITSEYCKKKKQKIARKMGLEDTHSMYQYLFFF